MLVNAERGTGRGTNVIDPYDAARDSDMPSLARALDPVEVEGQFEQRLKSWTGGLDSVRVAAIRVVRYKPRRRCVIEYDIEVERPHADRIALTLLGKVRVHRFGNSGYRLLRALWGGGFDAGSKDGISVPEPVGTVPALQMWLQRKVPGSTVTELLSPEPSAEGLVRRVAEAAHKLHEAAVPAERHHGIHDELRILGACLTKVGQTHPRWAPRLDRLLGLSARLAATMVPAAARGIHRDFYADQLIVGDRRLSLIDFDLYCQGDPALDVGNFIGHITEQSIRLHGDPDRLSGLEQAMEDRFVELAGEQCRGAVRVYAALTLARHVYLSTLFPERQPFTGRLLELAESRVGSGGLR